MVRIMQVLEKHRVLKDMQSGFRSGVSTTTSLLQFINALEQSEQKKSPLIYVSWVVLLDLVDLRIGPRCDPFADWT